MILQYQGFVQKYYISQSYAVLSLIFTFVQNIIIDHLAEKAKLFTDNNFPSANIIFKLPAAANQHYIHMRLGTFLT